MSTTIRFIRPNRADARKSRDVEVFTIRPARRTVQWIATRRKDTASQDIRQEDFDRLLLWLDADRSLAGERYERIRNKLTIIFAARGGAFPEEMADDCINRVAAKVSELIHSYEGEPELYFYGVVKFILLEWSRKPRPVELDTMGENIPGVELHAAGEDAAEVEGHFACLEKCLGQLAESSRELVLEYYQQDKKAKIGHRAALANRLGIAVNALRIRAHRIRQVLEKCVQQCINEPAGLRYQ